MTNATFGHTVMKWGTGDAAARSRINTITVDELKRYGVSTAIVESWINFYQDVVARNPVNPSARGRIDLLQHALRLLLEGK
jgi:hypothetical protein